MTTPLTLEVECEIPAPPARVFAAWLEPASLARWMRPGEGMTVPRVTTDPVVGGRYLIVMSDGTHEIPHEGEYLRIEPPHLLSFTWNSEPAGNTVVTVRLSAVEGGRTHLVLTQERLATAASRDAHRNGWGRILARLAAEIDSLGPAPLPGPGPA